MNRLLFLTVLVLGFGQLKSQTIEIGQDAKEIKQLIQWSTQQRTGFDSYGNSKGNNVTWDVKYNNGLITDVIQCYSNQYLIDFRVSASFCKHYIMEYGQLAYVLTQYEDVSTEQLTEFYENNYGEYKSGKFYFSDDYKHYSKIYLANNGYATVEWRKTEPDELPADIQTKISNKLKAEQDAEEKRIKEEEERKQKEREIKSKTYDLKENNISLYNQTFSEIKSDIADYFQKSSSYYHSSNIPSYTDLANGNEKKYRFTNTYTAYYKLEDHSRESVDYGSVIDAGSYDVRQNKEIKLVSGTDNSCSLFNSISVKIPTIKIQGYEVMTEATFPNIKVDYAKGVTIVKIKSGEVEFKSFPPDEDIQIKLKEKLKSEPNGKYIVQYEVGNIAGKEFVNTELEKKTTKVGSGWLLLGLLLLGLLL
ncbi:MAG: hypothetical protein HGGPFJEG_00710 [Ignavibacteria bacterium]|nr:hypothetical protein [Ignavibacteria bacterium]